MLNECGLVPQHHPVEEDWNASLGGCLQQNATPLAHPHMSRKPYARRTSSLGSACHRGSARSCADSASHSASAGTAASSSSSYLQRLPP